MSEATFTSGPWIIDRSGNIFGGASGQRLIANCRGRQQNFDTERNNAENSANAQLIAASPDLLAALEVLLEQCADGDLRCDHEVGICNCGIRVASTQARAAIAKATPTEESK
jgi:hypothetical protein